MDAQRSDFFGGAVAISGEKFVIGDRSQGVYDDVAGVAIVQPNGETAVFMISFTRRDDECHQMT